MPKTYHDSGLEYLGLTVIETKRNNTDARYMIEFGHYLHRWPGVVTCCLMLRCSAIQCGVPYNRAVGICVFALPPRETNKRYGGYTWELARLWISGEMPRNTETWFVAKAIAFVKKNHPQVSCLVSYADPSQGHCGTIYKAGNWISDGRTDQERKTPRFDYTVDGKKYSRRAHVPQGVVVQRVPRISKYRFVYWVKNHEKKRQAA